MWTMREERQQSLDAGQPIQAGLRQPNQRWLASLLLRRGENGTSRLMLFCQRLAALPRKARRQLVRKSAAALAGVALLLALGRAPAANAATINVDGVNCTLIEAIQTANSDSAVPGCTTGSGADTINLLTDVTLNASYGLYYESETGLPLITSTITIEGNGQTIERDTSGDKFRLMAVSSSGDLTINETTLTGGYAYYRYDSGPPYYNYFLDGDGGAIYSNGTLTITNSEISGNEANDDGGAISSYEGVITITNSEISGNTADRGGAIYHDYTTVTISNSELGTNIARYGGGGAIYNDEGELTIRNSTLSGNKSYDDDGGAIYNDHGTTTISQTTIYDNNVYDNVGGGIFNWDGTVSIDDSTIRNNSAKSGGGVYNNDGVMKVNNSTISNNNAYADSYGYDGNGGGVYNDYGETQITNSTISGNSAEQHGGGIFNEGGDVFITNSTITDNTANDNGGGVYQERGYAGVTFVRSLVSGNSATNGSEVYVRVNNTGFGNNRNVFGHAGLTDAAAFVNFTPGGTDTKATSNGTNVPLGNILETTLADNGGPNSGASGLTEPMLTHALVSSSPAIDKAPSNSCANPPTNGEDQRGYARNIDGNGAATTLECDAGAFEYGSTLPDATLFMTAAGPGTTGNGVAFGKEDILFWNGSSWSLFFDGSAAGLTTGKKGHDINAIHINDADDLYISFFQNKIMTTDLGQVFGTDILHYDGSNLSFFFDGSDVGLDKVAQEKIDAFHILDGDLSPVGGSCDAYLLISTFGTGQVPAANGGMLKFQGEDILGFCLSNPGLDTQGFWHMAVDGSAEGMPKNSTDSISASEDGEIIYLTTRAAFNVDSASGGDSEVYRYDTTTGSFSGPFFTAADNGLGKKVDGLHVVGELP